MCAPTANEKTTAVAICTENPPSLDRKSLRNTNTMPQGMHPDSFNTNTYMQSNTTRGRGSVPGIPCANIMIQVGVENTY